MIACTLRSTAPYCSQALATVGRRHSRTKMSAGGTHLKIGWLGLGAMGTAMAHNLLENGHKVTVWNRSVEKTIPLRKAGAEVADTPEAAACGSDIVFGLMANEELAIQMSKQVSKGLSPGKGYVDLTTTGPNTAEEVAKVIKAVGGLHIDCPISGTVEPAKQGKLIFMASGDKSLFDLVRPVLDIMGCKNMFLGQVGSASKLKLITNLFLGSTIAALAEALALARTAGISEMALLDVIGNGALNAPIFAIKGNAMVQSDYTGQGLLQYQLKDLKAAVSMSADLDLMLPMGQAASDLYSKASEAGLGAVDSCAVIQACFGDHKNVAR